MNEMSWIVALIAAILLAVLEAVMPKPRSTRPAKITVVSIISLLVITVIWWQSPGFISDNYLIVILIALVVIPVVYTLYVIHREELNVVLGKLDADNRRILEKIIGILQNIYFNEKKMVTDLSVNITEDKVIEMFSETTKILGLRLLNYLQSYDENDTVSFWGKVKIVQYAILDISVIAIISISSFFFPYATREMRFLKVAAVPDALGIGLDSVGDTNKDLNQTLKKRLWSATRSMRTTQSVNVIQKCLKYSHAINNMSLFKLKTPQDNMPYKLRLYSVLTQASPDHLISQRFAEVANVISKELAG